jgi:hypothetical protein
MFVLREGELGCVGCDKAMFTGSIVHFLQVVPRLCQVVPRQPSCNAQH